MQSTTSFRVYYEDTDAGGVVYHSNYLNFAERARTEFLRDHGINQIDLANNDDVLFVVKSLNLELFKPAKLDDMVEIETIVENISGASIDMKQTLRCLDDDLAIINVKIVCVSNNIKPKRIPTEVKKKINF